MIIPNKAKSTCQSSHLLNSTKTTGAEKSRQSFDSRCSKVCWADTYPWLANQWLNNMSQTLTISQQVWQVFQRKTAETGKVFLLSSVDSCVTFNSKMAAENSLFELEAVEVPPVNKNACRKWKPNFSVQEIALITQKFEENQAILKSKFTNTTTNKLKQSVWEEMTHSCKHSMNYKCSWG